MAEVCKDHDHKWQHHDAEGLPLKCANCSKTISGWSINQALQDLDSAPVSVELIHEATTFLTSERWAPAVCLYSEISNAGHSGWELKLAVPPMEPGGNWQLIFQKEANAPE